MMREAFERAANEVGRAQTTALERIITEFAAGHGWTSPEEAAKHMIVVTMDAPEPDIISRQWCVVNGSPHWPPQSPVVQVSRRDLTITVEILP